MSDLIANWIHPGSFVIFHYFNRNWNCCDYEVLLSCAYPSAQDRARLILIHVPCRNSLATLFYAVFINKRDIRRRNATDTRARAFICYFEHFSESIVIYYITDLIMRSSSLPLECRMTEERKETCDPEIKIDKITLNLYYNLLLLTSVLFCVYVCSCRVWTCLFAYFSRFS